MQWIEQGSTGPVTQALIEAPFGTVRITLQSTAVSRIELLESRCGPQPIPEGKAICQVIDQLEGYFSDSHFRFTVPLMVQGTQYRQRVWQALTDIGAGQTLTYGALARQLESAPRPIGGACRANPIALIVPCHRVVAANGAGGFAGERNGWPVRIKEWLLHHEGAAIGLH